MRLIRFWHLLLIAAVSGLAACSHLVVFTANDLLGAVNKNLLALSQPMAINAQGSFEGLFCEAYSALMMDTVSTRHCSTYLYRPNGDRTGSQAKQVSYSGDVTVLFVAGIFGECLKDAVGFYSNAREHLSKTKIVGGRLRTGVIDVSGYSSSRSNAGQIARYVQQLTLRRHEKLILVGYSKGATDIVEFLTHYPKQAEKVDAVLSVAGVILGSVLAGETDLVSKLLSSMKLSCRGPDGTGVSSLKREVRAAFFQTHQLPPHVDYYSIVGISSYFQTSLALRPLWLTTASVSPLNDSQVIYSDSVLPGAKVLAFVIADHWAIALPFETDNPLLAGTLVNRNHFPREAMIEAAVRVITQDF